jgi:hypothetical protein
MSSSNKPAWNPLLALGLTAIVLVGVPWSFKLLAAPALGDPCGDGFDCAALDGRCVQGETGSYCTITCEGDDECPSSGHCGVPPHDPWQQWFAKSRMSERFCVPGPPAMPSSRPQQAAKPIEMPEAKPR